MCDAYDIIEWKSCASSTTGASDISTDDKKQVRYYLGSYQLSRDGICSTNDIVFPKLFNEDPESEQSGVISMADMEYYGDGPLGFWKEKPPDDMEEQTVYQKVSSWVLSQRKYFLNTEPTLIEDDELEVIDPVDLFHESILNEYCLITENDCERRAVFRELKSDHYEIESIAEAMQTYEYKFLRKPKGSIEIELKPLIHFHHLYKKDNNNTKRKRKNSDSSTVSISISSSSSCAAVEREEESIAFLGVPRLLENYVIFNREGCAIKPDAETDLWLSPLIEELSVEEAAPDPHEEIEFLSSWFSEVYQDIHTDENRTLFTDKVTVISVSHGTEEEVWVDAPEIPHWLEGDKEDLELFNQPKRPLYYYRDRIKGCYRIIGVEDETVVLFSGNDDDTIFYNDDDDDEFRITKTFPEPRVTRNIFKEPKFERTPRALPYRRPNRKNSNDRKNDSGIEDIDDIVGEEVAVASLSLSDKEAAKLGYKTYQVTNTSWRQSGFADNETVLDWILIVFLGLMVIAFIVVYGLNDFENLLRRFQIRTIRDIYNDCNKFLTGVKTRLKV